MSYDGISLIVDAIFNLISTIVMTVVPIISDETIAIVITFSIVLISMIVYYTLVREIIIAHISHPKGINNTKSASLNVEQVFNEILINVSSISEQMKAGGDFSDYLIFKKWYDTVSRLEKFYPKWQKGNVILKESNGLFTNKIYQYELNKVCEILIESYNNVMASIVSDSNLSMWQAIELIKSNAKELLLNNTVMMNSIKNSESCILPEIIPITKSEI